MKCIFVLEFSAFAKDYSYFKLFRHLQAKVGGMRGGCSPIVRRKVIFLLNLLNHSFSKVAVKVIGITSFFLKNTNFLNHVSGRFGSGMGTGRENSGPSRPADFSPRPDLARPRGPDRPAPHPWFGYG